mmetsp:Transcript_19027/g.27990  ORF Transcript_19027/g.27990 Transcript_19027/m.27990 type:complete len:116 (+) Transcript_19027:1864-2211(+)
MKPKKHLLQLDEGLRTTADLLQLLLHRQESPASFLLSMPVSSNRTIKIWVCFKCGHEGQGCGSKSNTQTYVPMFECVYVIYACMYMCVYTYMCACVYWPRGYASKSNMHTYVPEF